MSKFLPIWPLIALLVSGALLAGAHAFETYGGLAPCMMCLQQRERHWVIVGAAVVALVLNLLLGKRVTWLPMASTLAIGALYGWSLFTSGHHVFVEQHILPAQCEAPNANEISVFGAQPLKAPPRCDHIAWQLFGISMAGYNGLISAAMALASFVIALVPSRNRNA